MAYMEIRKQGRLVSRRVIEDNQAQEGCKVSLGEAGEVRLSVGQSKTIGEYEISSFAGAMPEDGQTAVEGQTGEALPPTPGVQEAAPASQGQVEGAQHAPAKPVIEGYETIEPLGQGGMGAVWKARDLSTKREVAIKSLGRQRFDSDKAKARFEREVALAAKLTHPNIARVYASGLHRGGYYYVMEFIDGVHLDEFVRQQERPAREVLELMAQVCDAVCHAHSLGIIHRDLKPSNILVSKDGQPHIVDFGLARLTSPEDYDLTISVEGEITGTPAYMAPEQAAGRHDQISERTDVYSLGVILYQLLTGRLPHPMEGGRYDVLRRIIEEEAPSPCTYNEGVDRELEALALTALAREPQQRYPSAAALQQDIKNYLTGAPLQARSLSRVYRLRKRAARLTRPIIAVFLFLGIVAASVTVTRYWVTPEKARRSEGQADSLRTKPGEPPSSPTPAPQTQAQEQVSPPEPALTQRISGTGSQPANKPGSISTARLTLDQQSGPDQPSANLWVTRTEDGRNGLVELQQTITAGVTGQLVQIELYAARGVGSATLFLNKSTWQTSERDFTTTIRATRTGWFAVDVRSAKLGFDKGDKFVLGIVGLPAPEAWYLGMNPQSYPGGEMWSRLLPPTPPTKKKGASLAFRTYVDEQVRSLTIDADEGGSVAAPGTGTFIYDLGTTLDLKAVPSASYRFAGWTGAATAGAVTDRTAMNTTITITGHGTLHARFEPVAPSGQSPRTTKAGP